ncbi:MAG TPA: APC family permease [Nitrolancea sp.]|nr:APC family permease [Nitrolancea sp.]
MSDNGDDDANKDATEQNRDIVRGRHPGDRYVRVIRAKDLPVGPKSQEYLIAPPSEATTPLGRAYQKFHRFLIGNPIESAQAVHERLSKSKALAVFSSDALSSTAYATEEILLILVVAGAAAYTTLIPIGIAIAALLGIVVFSYRQTINAYPNGGGSYIVTKDNLGRKPSLLAASALLSGYILTVAVSVSAGVAAMTSAIDGLAPYRVWIAVGAILFIMLANLRGVRESGTIFAVPTYLFIGCMVVIILLGFLAWAGLGIGFSAHPVHYPMPAMTSALTAFVVLRAFAAGCAALTGVEAIADGVPAFKEPQARNAATTLVWMGIILGTLFLGVTLLTRHFHLVPATNETIVSQLTRTVVGTSPFYYISQAATAAILVLGANTAFADFPRLSYFLARDGFMPHQFMARGDRLAFSTGIVALSGAALVLVVSFHAQVSALIPLYAVGVFVAFTMSQSSMTYRWWRSPHSRHRLIGLLINGAGALTTAGVVLINITTRFLDGAWMVLILLPLIIMVMLGIRRHYDSAAEQLRVKEGIKRPQSPDIMRETAAIVPVSSLDRATFRAIDYAERISRDVTAIHVTDDPEEADQLRQQWTEYGMSFPLVIIESPYREIVGPLVNYIESVQQQHQGVVITVVLSEFVPAHLYELLLHNQTTLRLKLALWRHPKVVVVNVPYHLEH